MKLTRLLCLALSLVFVLVCFAACGGNKFRALDVMFANKFVRKITNIFDDGMSDNLDKLVSLIDTNFGKDNFVESVKQIALIKKKIYY